jgi:hypothetical protein
MKPNSSKTTTSQKALVSSIGTQDGGHGSETPESLAIAAWLARRTPEEVDQAAVWRASQHGIEVFFQYSYYDMSVRACDIQGDADRSAVAAELAGFLTPAPVRVIEGWLAELSVITARRQGDQEEEELRLAAYASRLARYPADVARYVCLGKTWKFWPTWAEMEEICTAKVSARRRLLIELEGRPEPAIDERPMPTAEERERIQELVNQLFPNIARRREADHADDGASKGRRANG